MTNTHRSLCVLMLFAVSCGATGDSCYATTGEEGVVRFNDTTPGGASGAPGGAPAAGATAVRANPGELPYMVGTVLQLVVKPVSHEQELPEGTHARSSDSSWEVESSMREVCPRDDCPASEPHRFLLGVEATAVRAGLTRLEIVDGSGELIDWIALESRDLGGLALLENAAMLSPYDIPIVDTAVVFPEETWAFTIITLDEGGEPLAGAIPLKGHVDDPVAVAEISPFTPSTVVVEGRKPGVTELAVTSPGGDVSATWPVLVEDPAGFERITWARTNLEEGLVRIDGEVLNADGRALGRPTCVLTVLTTELVEFADQVDTCAFVLTSKRSGIARLDLLETRTRLRTAVAITVGRTP